MYLDIALFVPPFEGTDNILSDDVSVCPDKIEKYAQNLNRTVCLEYHEFKPFIRTSKS